MVPTGAGKTGAVILAWLWRRRWDPDLERRRQTPRRLVYCLPARVLVTQTADAAREYLANLEVLADGKNEDGVALHVVMGGDADDSWMRYPEREAILIGTQDMLLSRALNRGYGARRFRWPALFGLLNNDCLWVLDEVQLMGSGLYTSAQMDAFRREFGTFGGVRSLWMSATAEPGWLGTLNREAPSTQAVLRLGEEDKTGSLAERLNAHKIIEKAPVQAVPRSKAESSRCAAEMAAAILKHHVEGSLTLVVVNTVDRATAVFRQLVSSKAKPEILLIHSKFRPADRGPLEARMKEPVDPKGPGRVVVSTQVIEAGMDLSARTLVTELAPWSSLVQRWGRANRKGEYSSSTILWVDLPDDASAPYSPEELSQSRKILDGLEGKSVGPSVLPTVRIPYEPRYAFRHRDFTELFDTTPDISGSDIDISRFVRGQDDPDVRVFWRDWEGIKPPDDQPVAHRSELCPVRVADLKKYRAKHPVWRWDHVDGRWVDAGPRDIYPGQEYLVNAEEGGYEKTTGWSPDSRQKVDDVRPEGWRASPEKNDDRRRDYAGRWVLLREHSDDVVDATLRITSGLEGILPPEAIKSLETAARWHDRGKAHCVFQEALLRSLPEPDKSEKSASAWAKRPKDGGPGVSRPTRYSRPHFRHELASALAVLANLKNPLVAYLVASHHGRVRTTIRSLPGEALPPSGRRYALGVWDGDPLPATDLGGVLSPATTLDLECMDLGIGASGRPSWVDEIAGLLARPDLGPFRLAYLESLLVAADWAASSKEGGDDDDRADAT
ncbi:MAG: CRISPR-associated helicase Cas3' [Firmicutes bacterium]|nr:CRISPR-associated helicase Cas3' [Bacillota bacterium]